MKKTLALAETVCWATSIVVTYVLMALSSGWKTWVSPIMLWACAPYFVLGTAAFMLRRSYPDNRSIPVASFVTSLLVLGFTLLVYVDGCLIHTSSTSALLFLFVPVWIFIGSPVVWTVTSWISTGLWKVRKKRTEPAA